MKVSEEKFFELKESMDVFKDIKILTPSMAPFIKVNDMVKAMKVDPNDLNPYDIIIFWQNEKLICHFLIKKENNMLISRGLNTKVYDEPIDPKYILAKVVRPKLNPMKKFFLSFLLR